jgi:hypothetical protein
LKSFWLRAALVATVALARPARAAEPSDAISWYSIVTQNGTAIGHASQEIVAEPDGSEIIDAQEVDVGEQVGPPTQLIGAEAPSTHISSRTIYKQDRSGRMISIATVTEIGRSWSHIDARIEAGKAEVTRETVAEKRTTTIDLPSGVRFDGGDGLFKTWDRVRTPRLEFENFNIDAMAVEHVVIEAVAGQTPDPEGRTVALRMRYEGSQLRTATRLTIDRAGNIVESRQPIFGVTLIAKATDRDTALQPHAAYRVLPNVMTRSPFRILEPATEGHIRYRFGFRDGIEFSLPQTGEQRVTAEPGFATVDICEGCGPGLATDAATLADALKPTAWLQSDHPKLKAIADPIAKLPISDTRKMEMLLDKARPYLGTIDFTGHYSALETLSRRSGDCTEASVLLAALGRAAGIPTRVANGLVYSRESYHGVANAFMPHSWTLAFADGKWRSFDLALDKFDSTHIALTVGDGDERSLQSAGQLAGLLVWDGMVEVKTRPAN